jgi:hypothetical protein
VPRGGKENLRSAASKSTSRRLAGIRLVAGRATQIAARGGRGREELYPGVGHARIPCPLAPPLRRLAPVREDTIDFTHENERRYARR